MNAQCSGAVLKRIAAIDDRISLSIDIVTIRGRQYRRNEATICAKICIVIDFIRLH